MDKTFSVVELSERLNKSKSTIYEYLKKGSLKGTKVNGVWVIDYKEDTTTINKSVYLDKLNKLLDRYKHIEKEIIENLQNKLKINIELLNIETNSRFTKSLPKTLKKIAEEDKVYVYVKNNKDKLENKITSLLENYKELNSIIDGIAIEKIQYSKTSESVYVTVEKNNLIEILNKMSEMGKRFVIVNKDLFNNDFIKVRFSNHLPDYYKENTIKTIEEERKFDVIIPYTELEDNLVIHERTKEEEMEIIEINKKIQKAKKYGKRKINKLNKEELENYYNISQELLSLDRIKEDAFIKHLEVLQNSLLRRLNSIA